MRPRRAVRRSWSVGSVMVTPFGLSGPQMYPFAVSSRGEGVEGQVPLGVSSECAGVPSDSSVGQVRSLPVATVVRRAQSAVVVAAAETGWRGVVDGERHRCGIGN